MKHSKAGKKLSPELNAVILPIYTRDPVRYKNICRWVWWQQSRGCTDESIINCITMADKLPCHGGHDGRLDSVEDWWSYLVKLMPKASARAHEDEGAQHKRADMAIALEFVEFFKARKRA